MNAVLTCVNLDFERDDFFFEVLIPSGGATATRRRSLSNHWLRRDSVAHASFHGLRVLSLESRRAREVEKLIRTYGGEPVVVPSMREVELESNQETLAFASRVINGEFDLVIFLT